MTKIKGVLARPLPSIVFLAVFLFGAAIRLYGLRDQLFWGDEAWNIRMAHEISWEIPQLFSRDSHPPLFHFLLDCLINTIGVDSPVNLRLLSVVPGLFLLALGIVWGSNLFGHWLGGLAFGWLIATSPLLIEQSQEVRNYSLFLLFSGLVFYSLTKQEFKKSHLYTAS